MKNIIILLCFATVIEVVTIKGKIPMRLLVAINNYSTNDEHVLTVGCSANHTFMYVKMGATLQYGHGELVHILHRIDRKIWQNSKWQWDTHESLLYHIGSPVDIFEILTAKTVSIMVNDQYSEFDFRDNLDKQDTFIDECHELKIQSQKKTALT